MRNKFYCPDLKELNDKFAELTHKNPFGLLFDIREIFSTKPTPNGLGHTRISTTGKLEICDYGVGLLVVSVKLVGQGNKPPETTDYFVQFHIQSGDDSSWIAWSKPYKSKEDCLEMVKKVSELLTDLICLPSSEDLNEMLRPYGLYGEIS
jgi:hypothetical protein